MTMLDKDLAADVVQQLAFHARETAQAHGFSNDLVTGIALGHSEWSEALEAYRDDILDGYDTTKDPAKPVGVVSELADVIIRALDVAEQHFPGRIGTVLLEKMTFNDSRPAGHGRVRL